MVIDTQRISPRGKRKKKKKRKEKRSAEPIPYVMVNLAGSIHRCMQVRYMPVVHEQLSFFLLFEFP